MMAVLTMLSSLPANFSLINVVSFSTSRLKIFAIRPRMKMFLPLSLAVRSEEHTSELQSRFDLVCRLLLEKKNTQHISSVESHVQLQLLHLPRTIVRQRRLY